VKLPYRLLGRSKLFRAQYLHLVEINDA